MTMESIEKLRELVEQSRNEYVQGSVSYNVGFNEIADEIEREIAERYMELPVDADGVPIHVGDVLEYGDRVRATGIVKALNGGMVIAMHVDETCSNYAKYGLLWEAEGCHHVKPDPVRERVMRFLRDVEEESGLSYGNRVEVDDSTIDEFIADIREAVSAE